MQCYTRTHVTSQFPALSILPRPSLIDSRAPYPTLFLAKDRGAVALSGSFAAELAVEQRLDADQQDDADHPYQCYASPRGARAKRVRVRVCPGIACVSGPHFSATLPSRPGFPRS